MAVSGNRIRARRGGPARALLGAVERHEQSDDGFELGAAFALVVPNRTLSSDQPRSPDHPRVRIPIRLPGILEEVQGVPPGGAGTALAAWTAFRRTSTILSRAGLFFGLGFHVVGEATTPRSKT